MLPQVVDGFGPSVGEDILLSAKASISIYFVSFCGALREVLPVCDRCLSAPNRSLYRVVEGAALHINGWLALDGDDRREHTEWVEKSHLS